MSSLRPDIGLKNNNNAGDLPYNVDPSRWYKSYPYGFSFFNAESKKSDPATETFWLPIAPNNINVTTHYATNIVTTLYGIIEEHSEIRYYDIVIQGNTGIAPKYTVPFALGDKTVGTGTAKIDAFSGLPDPSAPGSPSTGRTSFKPAGGVDFKGFLPEITNTINAAANLAKSISGGTVENPTGIQVQQSGYYAFHNFYKFLHRYKLDTSRTSGDTKGVGQDVASRGVALGLANVKGFSGGISDQDGRRALHPLQFLNYKDNIKYDVIPISFTLTRSAENPMLYNYSIRMRAFNLRNVNAKPPESDRLAELGLGDLGGSLFSKATSIAGNASRLISGIKGAF